MDVSVGTFNLNNLFSRFNFEAQVDAIVEDDPDSGLTATYTFNDPERFRLRTYQGRLVHGKIPADQETIAARIAAMDLDVLCAQEVEDIDTLRFFTAQHLNGRYRFLTLVEGNDPRLIDLAVLSKLPLGPVVTHQHAVHPEAPDEAVFSRDLLEVDILHPTKGTRLLTLFNNHLKSQFVPFDQDPVAGKQAADDRRRRQAETIEQLVAARTRPDSRYLITGDLNDAPEAPTLAAIAASDQLQLVNGLAQPTETRPPKADVPPAPAHGAWTHRFKEAGQPAHYELFDQIWLSPSLAARQTGAFIDRRTRHGGDGSDHDPAWVTLDL
jgi:endonuclease/exonuclease/phosphatase family metal-dependent hydrolase